MQSPALSAACPACPVETTLTLISDKWKVLILRDLMPGTKRFGELKKSIGTVSQKVLTAQLRDMEAKGLLPKGASANYTMVRFDMTHTPTGLPSEADIKTFADWMKANRILKKDPAYGDVVFQ